MKIKLPVTWQVCGMVEVEAESIDDAIENFDPEEHSLPKDTSYVDGSFELSFNDAEAIAVMQTTPKRSIKKK